MAQRKDERLTTGGWVFVVGFIGYVAASIYTSLAWLL